MYRIIELVTKFEIRDIGNPHRLICRRSEQWFISEAVIDKSCTGQTNRFPV